jgi:hypothetical protein
VTSSSDPDTRSLQRAKRSLLKKYGERKWFRGVGIVPTEGGLCLRLNIDSEATLGENEIPATWHNIAIEIVRTKGYETRGN